MAAANQLRKRRRVQALLGGILQLKIDNLHRDTLSKG